MKHPVKKKAAKSKSTAPNKQITKPPNNLNRNYFIPLLGIIIISFLAYLPALQNHLVWDDDQYVLYNTLIHSINLNKLFSTYVMGNYHPVTMLVYALEYHSFKLNETGYHAVNLMLHLANVILVFYVILLLSDKATVALVAALLFGIHPMHVESVAWASQLKDLLYTFFFLSSYICYLKYLRGNEKKYYFYCLLFFILSMLSKAMAVALPVVLSLTDYFFPYIRNSVVKEQRSNSRIWLEKIPFFIIAVILGIVAVFAQKSAGATEVIAFPFPQRIIFACYGFITYLLKLAVPLHLNALYGYPVREGASIPSNYYIYTIFCLIFIIAVFYSLRFTKKIFFGVAFFSATVFLVLQLFPVGNALMADRYSYIPSIGIFYLAGEGFYWLWNRKWKAMSLKPSAIILLVVFTVLFSYRTYSRCTVWKDGMTLWNDVIKESPDVSIAYYNRAVLLKDEGKLDEAFNDFNKTIMLEPHYIHAYNNRGIIEGMRKDYEDAIKDFTKAIQLEPHNVEAYSNRAISFQNENKFDEAIRDYNKTIELQPNSPQAFYNRAVIEYNSGQKEKACADFQQAVNLKFPMAEETYHRLCH